MGMVVEWPRCMVSILDTTTRCKQSMRHPIEVWLFEVLHWKLQSWRPMHQPVPVRRGIHNTGDLWYYLLCSVLLCSVHYGLYANRSHMQCDKNCMDLNIYGDHSLDSCPVLIILNECSCDFVTYSWVIDCWYFNLWTRLYTYIPE